MKKTCAGGLLRTAAALAASAALALVAPRCLAQQEPAPPPPPEPDIAPVAPPAGAKAVVLFSGKEEDLEKNWNRKCRVQDGAMVMGGGDMVTKQSFRDFQLHLEFREPFMPGKKGQERGNSGVYLHGRYEVQVLDSYGIEKPGTGDCGGVYQQYAVLANACKPPRWWQTYDFLFRAPRVDAMGKVAEPARVTVILNGQVVQNNVQIKPTPGGTDMDAWRTTGVLKLQDHGCPVEYRNIWVIPLVSEASKVYDH